MNSNKPGAPPPSKPDDLIRSNTVELNEEELDSVGGGIKIGSKAESLLHPHKDELRIETLTPHLKLP